MVAELTVATILLKISAIFCENFQPCLISPEALTKKPSLGTKGRVYVIDHPQSTKKINCYLLIRVLTLKGNELLLNPNNASREGPYRHLTQ